MSTLSSSNKQMTCYTFGRELLRLNDLDPLYVALWESDFEPDHLRRWLLAFWCFYHSGTSSWIADREEGYWKRFREAAGSKEYPRCHERRHFRGAAALKAVDFLEERGVPSLFNQACRRPVGGSVSVGTVMANVQRWYLFGPWIAFKVSDMLERLNLCPITFDDGAMFLFDSPREGAELLWTETHQSEREVGAGFIPPDVGPWAVGSILQEIGRVPAPPRYERPINAQEAETILCKWKSYRGGHYHLGEDVEGLRKGLLRFARCRTSQRLLVGGRKGGLWLR